MLSGSKRLQDIREVCESYRHFNPICHWSWVCSPLCPDSTEHKTWLRSMALHRQQLFSVDFNHDQREVLHSSAAAASWALTQKSAYTRCAEKCCTSQTSNASKHISSHEQEIICLLSQARTRKANRKSEKCGPPVLSLSEDLCRLHSHWFIILRF